MAEFKFEVSEGFAKMLNRLDTLYDDACEDVLNAGGKIVTKQLKAANSTFAKYVKLKKPKKNKYGWFSYVTFAGKTSDGNRANTAAFINEYGRGGKNPQPARPFIRSATRACEKEVVDAMEKVLEAKLNEHS